MMTVDSNHTNLVSHQTNPPSLELKNSATRAVHCWYVAINANQLISATSQRPVLVYADRPSSTAHSSSYDMQQTSSIENGLENKHSHHRITLG